MATKIRKERLESFIQNEISFAISKELDNKDLKKATITGVALTTDLSQAKIYVDTFNRSEISKIVSLLNEHSGLFRSLISKKITLRKSPKLLFAIDTSIDESQKIENLIKQLKK